MNTLIVYYSYTLNNEKIAKEIQKRLGCDILKIEELRKRTGFTIFFDLIFNRAPSIKTAPCVLKYYDQVIFIAPIWAGKIAFPLKTFFLREKHNIRRYFFITVCGGVAGQKDKIINQLTSYLGNRPAGVTELRLNDLPKVDSENKVKSTTMYRIDEKDVEFFDTKINTILKLIQSSMYSTP